MPPLTTVAALAPGDLEAVISSVEEAVFVADEHGEPLSMNPPALRLHGYDSLEQYPRTMAERAAAFELTDASGAVLSPEAWPLARAVRGEATRNLELHVRRRSGGSFVGLYSAIPLTTGSGRRLITVTIRDITALKAAQAESARDEARFCSLAEATPQLVWTARAEGDVDFANERWYRYTGQPPHGAEGRGLLHAVHPDELALVTEAWDAALRSGATYEVACRLLRADGEFRWFLTRAVALRDASGRVLRWFGSCTDVHELKSAEQTLRDEALRKNDFLALLSHELRNPLAPIRGSLYLLRRTSQLDEAGRRHAAVIDRQVNQLARLVDDLLDVTRIARQKVRLQRARLDLAWLVRSTVEDHRALLASTGVALELSLPARPVEVDGDEARLAQVVGNLLSNAAKFTPAGGRVRVTLSSAAGRACLEVADDGMGMDAATLQRLFEPFTQADRSLDRSRGGLGLGLALVRGLVELHGGAVVAASDGAGRGARLSVSLPLAADARAQLAEPRRVATRGGAARRILVVEDNPDAAETLREVLELAGHEVAAASDGHEALSMARTFRPEVVLCDIGLPGLDGYEVARRLRKDATLAPTFLVALTGYAQPQDRRRAEEAGFDRHLAKPPDLDALDLLLAEAPVVEPDAAAPAGNGFVDASAAR